MQRRSQRESIPAFLSIDVEPEGFQMSAAALDWAGFSQALTLAASLREALARIQPRAPAFGWYFRTDPQIGHAFGRPDAALHRFAEPIARLRAHGDYFGVHMHPVRWSTGHDRWIHDVADVRWLRACTHASLDVFEQWSGTPTQLFRGGAGFMSEDVVDVLDERGVTLEMSLEPTKSWALGASAVPSGIDDSPIEGAFIDCSSAPTTPYHPARGDFRRPGKAQARNLLFIPLSSGPYSITPPDWWSQAKRSVRRVYKPRNRHLYYPAAVWPSPRYFWDVVDYSLSTMERPYLSLGIRTDREGSTPDAQVRAILRELVTHPIASRLRFMNPLEAMETLVDRPLTSAAVAAASSARRPGTTRSAPMRH